MIVLVDTNVLLSAIWRDKNPQQVILYLIDHPEITWAAPPEILAEYHNVLARKKFALPAALLNYWYTVLDRAITIIEAAATEEFPRDPKDAKFLDCARAVNADWIITGDRDFDLPNMPGRTRAISVAKFLRMLDEITK